MINLREQVESDLSFTLEGAFGLPAVFVPADGDSFEQQAQIIYTTTEYDAESGAPVVVRRPVVVVRASTMPQIPANGEKWIVQIPVTPDADADKEAFLHEGRPTETGGSIGFLRFYLDRANLVVAP